MSGYGAGSGIFGPVSSSLIEHVGWRSTFKILAAIFFGALIRGGLFVDIFTLNVSKDLVLVLQALVILFVAAEALFSGAFRRFGFGKR